MDLPGGGALRGWGAPDYLAAEYAGRAGPSTLLSSMSERGGTVTVNPGSWLRAGPSGLNVSITSVHLRPYFSFGTVNVIGS